MEARVFATNTKVIELKSQELPKNGTKFYDIPCYRIFISHNDDPKGSCPNHHGGTL
jgi:hypothetical protein